jgi:ParB-like chromosome segregation protein Spo0J
MIQGGLAERRITRPRGSEIQPRTNFPEDARNHPERGLQSSGHQRARLIRLHEANES